MRIYLPLFICSAFFLHAELVTAQNFQSIGIDTTSNQRYECVRFGNPDLNTILVTSLDTGKEVNLKIATAKKRLGRSIKKNIKRKKTLRKQVKRIRKKLTRETKKIGASREKINRLKEQIERLTVKIGQQDSRNQIIASLRESVGACNKDLPLNGDLEVLTNIEVPPGRQDPVFSSVIAYKLNKYPKEGKFCAYLSGANQDILGSAGTSRADGLNVMSVASEPCILSYNGDCLVKASGSYVFFRSFGGTEAPGSCSPAARCSAAVASATLNAAMAAMSVLPAGGGSSCEE